MAARAFEREVELFRQHGGSLRMSEALRLGINRKTLYAMRDTGVLESVTRGLYRLASLEPPAHPDLVTVATHVPKGICCLISALSFHELTTQVPHVIDVALERGTRKPRLDYPPTRFFWFSGPAFHEGIEMHELDGAPVRIYDPEKDTRRQLPVPEPDRHGRGAGGDAAAARAPPQDARRTPEARSHAPRQTRDAALPEGDVVTDKNLSASVHARLQNQARTTKRPFQELLQYFAMERFLFRLSTTPHRARFVLRGALMLHVWNAPLARATKDLDFLGRLNNSSRIWSAWLARCVLPTSSRMA